MKLQKLTQTGLAHYILPLVVVVLVGIVGVAVLLGSHAATLHYLGYNNNTSVANNNGTSVFTSQDYLAGIGAQNVSDIIPGAKLIYNYFPGKTAFSSVCYQVRVYNSPKAATQVTSANITFVGLGNSKTMTLPVDSNYHEVCVASGKSSQLGYNIWNQSALAYVLVYQAVTYY